jgi:hypothetical protein
MHMTFEKIADEYKHPAARAAAMVKELHRQNIELIDQGRKFVKKNEAGVDEDVSEQMKAASEEQMIVCDDIIRRADRMPPELAGQAHFVLQDLQEVLAAKAKAEDENALPEVGNYDHGK